MSDMWELRAVDRVEVRSPDGDLLWTHAVPVDVRPYRFELPDAVARSAWSDLIEIIYLSDGRETERTMMGAMRDGGTIFITVLGPRPPARWPS